MLIIILGGKMFLFEFVEANRHFNLKEAPQIHQICLIPPFWRGEETENANWSPSRHGNVL